MVITFICLASASASIQYLGEKKNSLNNNADLSTESYFFESTKLNRKIFTRMEIFFHKFSSNLFNVIALIGKISKGHTLDTSLVTVDYRKAFGIGIY